MSPSKIRKALGKVKDRTSISLAKVNSNSLSELDVLIVKATRHEEEPADERYIRELLSITSYSKEHVSSCVNTLSRRLNKTKTWTVALKTLMLIHRLLLEGDPAFKRELFYATRRGTRLLNMSDFRDKKKYGSWDYSAFVRTYALYLDEQLEVRMQNHLCKRPGSYGGDEDNEMGSTSPLPSPSPSASSVRNTPVREMKTDSIFTIINHLNQLLERFLACRPTGPAKENRVMLVALYPIVKESFNIYYDITEIMAVLIERFMELSITDCAKVYDIFTRISKQFDELHTFYSWCKTVAVARSSEYPEIERIESRKLNAMDDFIREKAAFPQENEIGHKNPEPRKDVEVVEEEDETTDEIKALPAPPLPQDKVEEETQEEYQETENEKIREEIEADLLNLKDDQVTTEEQGDRLALALFDGDGGASETTTTTDWVAFASDDLNWETALVDSASNLRSQKADLGGGFDMLLLEGMYTHNHQQPSNEALGAGSASSVVVLQTNMLALPAPPVSSGSGSGVHSNSDPFAASLSVAPPPYVQMSEMEIKQKLVVEEQVMWQRYANDGMQGRIKRKSPFTMGKGGYTRI